MAPDLRRAAQVQESGALYRLWTGAAADLPDINVWIALAVREHPHHAAAAEYWAQVMQQERGLWFCRVTMLGLVRLLCQPRVMGPGALDALQAWALYGKLRAVPRVGLVAEPEDCEEQLRLLLNQKPALPPRLWTDAYLAALAQACGARMVTFDQDFARFRLKSCLVLPTAAA